MGCNVEECPRCGLRLSKCDCPIDEAVLEEGASLTILAKACRIVTTEVYLDDISMPLVGRCEGPGPD